MAEAWQGMCSISIIRNEYNTKHVRIWTRYDAAENVVIVVVQRGLHLLVVGLVVDVHVEGHPGDVEHGQGVTPSFF